MRFNLIIMLLVVSVSAIAQQLAVYDLSAEHKVNPIGIEDQAPRLSWKINASGKNILQTAYAIRVATTPDFSATNLVWESGKISSGESILQPYQGPALQSGARYHWQVKIWDNRNKESKWSPAAFWEMGLLHPSDWKAQWIVPVQDSSSNGPASMLRKEFSLGKQVKRARAYVTAHGLYEMRLNGSKVGDQLFTPGWTSYNERLQYQVYDVTNLLKEGENAVGVLLGDGWYKGRLGWEKQWGYYGNKTGLFCQLVIEYGDGTADTVISDGSWKSTNHGPLRMNSLYDGETYDARKEIQAWDRPGFNDSFWKEVTVADFNINVLVSTETVPVRRIQEVKPDSIFLTPRGTLVVDMGQNMVGWVRLQVKGSAGTTVTLRHAEVLDKEGEFYTDNLRSAKATIRYTLKGDGVETYEPTFTFMGFRYVAVEGFPGKLTPEDLTGIVIHSDMEVTGSFECSNDLVNQLQKNILWGQKGNFLDVPTDCPQRNERMGWTGDAQAFISTAAFNMNVAAFFTKWLKDVAADQSEEGAVPFVVPNVLGGVQASAGWADVATIAPWTIYQVYGDKQLLENQYPSMKAYVDFMIKDAGEKFIWEGGSVFGDWLFYKPELNHWTVPDGHTDQDFIATAFFAYSTKLLIDAARVLGEDADVEKYGGVLKKIKNAFNYHYITPAGRTASDSQTSYVLALMFGLLPEDQRGNAIKYLVENIRNRDNHLSTGFLGTPYLCHVLSDNGFTDVAYDLLLQESFPSWLYPVKMGATTIWERWDGIKTDSTFQNKGMNSFNHYAYGAIGDWMYRVVAGINPKKPGYKQIHIYPQPDERLTYAKAAYESSYGQIVSAWERKDGQITMKVKVPVNTTAIITFPNTKSGAVTENGKMISRNPSFKNLRDLNGNAILETGSGEYEFVFPASENLDSEN